MGSPTVLVVPAVPRATVTPLRVCDAPPRAVVPVQPMPVPQAYVLSVQTARADAETVFRLQAEIDALRARLPLAG